MMLFKKFGSSFLLSLFLMAGIAASAQGIQFEKGSVADALKKAREQQRMLYVDVSASWCGPCKLLEKLVFPEKSVGDYFNSHFVNLHLDGEVGEGIAFAAKYQVTAFPTHLFLDPADGHVVFRSAGYKHPEPFCDMAKAAVKERNDPMTWEKYLAAFPSKRKDRKFLKAWLVKADRIHKDNTEILNAYVVTLDRQHPTDSDIQLLAKYIQTIDNNAVPLVVAHKNLVKGPDSTNTSYFTQLRTGWNYASLEKAIRNKDEKLLRQVEESLRETEPASAEENAFYYRIRYYQETGDSIKAAQQTMAQADFLEKKSLADYLKEDSASLQSSRRNITWQLKEHHIPDDSLEYFIALNLRLHPELAHTSSTLTANKLNNAAWAVYENSTSQTDAALIRRALGWAEKAKQLIGEDLNNWAAFSDTHAHLLYRSGDKAGAIQEQQNIIKRLDEAGIKHDAGYEQELEKMKQGSL